MSTTSNTSDVVIVGAGLVGAIVARRLAEAGLNVVVLEARSSPGGIAARGTGLALLGTPEPYTALQERVGKEAARDVWMLTRKNLALLKETLDRLGLEGREVGSLRMTDSSAVAPQLQRSVHLLQEEGYPVSLEDGTEMGYLVGIATEGDVAFDQVALVEALLDHPQVTVENKAEVHVIKRREETPEGEGLQLTIWAHRHYLWTKGVVLAGGAHAVHLSRSLGSIVRPLELQSVDLRATVEVPAPLILADGQVLVQHQEDDICRMVGWNREEGDVLPLLTDVGQQICPDAPVVTRQAAWISQSRDGLPIVGDLPDLPAVYTVGGLGPWGMSWAFVAAERLAALMLEDSDPGLLGIDRLFASK